MIAQLLARRQEIDWPYWRTITAGELTAKWEDYFRREALPRMMRTIAASPEANTVLEIARPKSIQSSGDESTTGIFTR